MKREAILSVVRAHYERGTPRHVIRRALCELAADNLAPTIDSCVQEVYG